jgi:hypothetical protein
MIEEIMKTELIEGEDFYYTKVINALPKNTPKRVIV